MKQAFLLLLLFSFIDVAAQGSKSKLKGWLLFFDETGIYFPMKDEEKAKCSLDFFRVKDRINGIDLNMSPTDMEKYKKYGTEFSEVSFSYGRGPQIVTILPVKYRKVITESTRALYRNTTRNLKQADTKIEIMFKQEKYLIGYRFFDSSYITDIVPLLKSDGCKN